jgi:gluconate 5-dehydrogenase
MTEKLLKEHTLIIGGSSGIGKDLALRLSLEDNVSVLARRKDELNKLSQINGIYTYNVDVINDSDIENALKECVSKFGKVNKMIYCAGAQIIKPHRLMKINEFDTLYNVNLRGALVCSKLFCSAKTSHKDAVFCAVSSIASSNPEPGIIAYSSMKAGLDNMIRGLAKEYGPRRFIGVAPGWLDTEMTQNQALYNDEFKAALESNSPLGLTSVTNIVDSISFLISSKASSVTGQILTIDSGSSL